METIKGKAEEWAVECGLKGPFATIIKIEPYGFSVEIMETTGRQRSAHCTFQRDGSRSLYELTSRN